MVTGPIIVCNNFQKNLDIMWIKIRHVKAKKEWKRSGRLDWKWTLKLKAQSNERNFSKVEYSFSFKLRAYRNVAN